MANLSKSINFLESVKGLFSDGLEACNELAVSAAEEDPGKQEVFHRLRKKKAGL